MSPGLDWIIFYGDGTQFSSLQGTPWDAPRLDVQVIVQLSEIVGYELVFGYDHFYYEKRVGGWCCTAEFGFYDHLIRARYPCPLFGRMMNTPDWEKLLRIVVEQMGPKSGWLKKEIESIPATQREKVPIT